MAFKFEINQKVHNWDSQRLSFVEHRWTDDDGKNFYTLHDNSRWPISPNVPEWMIRPYVSAYKKAGTE